MGDLFVNGKVFITEAANAAGPNAAHHAEPTFAEALHIQDGVIKHVGAATDGAIVQAREAGAAVHDLGGKTLLPGFIDGHIHLRILGATLKKADLTKCKSLADIRAVIKAYAEAHPAGEVARIFASNYMHSMVTEGTTAADLDDLDPRPIFVDTKDLHAVWCNTQALKDMDVESWTPVPGGTIERGADGKLTGWITEGAVFKYVWPYVARVASMEERMGYIKAAVAAYHAAGYTGMIDMAMDETSWEAIRALLAAEGPAAFPMRLACYWLVQPRDDPAEHTAQVARAIELAAQFNGRTSPDCRIVGIKVVCDGIIDACTAGLTEPYSHNGQVTNPLWTAEMLAPVVSMADKAGLQVALHAIGDATIRTVIDALEAHASPARRPRVEHLELSSPEDAARLGKLGITASIQPVHCDPAILHAWPRLLGDDRCKRAFAYREFADGGAPIALGSDAPTAPHAPIGNIYVGTTRRSYREPDTTETVNPHFALGLCEAVVAASQGAAYSSFDDHRVGRLAPGLKADLVVVDMAWDKDKLLEAKVLETWFEGKKVWSA